MKTVDQPADYYGLSLFWEEQKEHLEEMTNIYASFSRVLNHYGETGKYYPGDYRGPIILPRKIR